MFKNMHWNVVAALGVAPLFATSVFAQTATPPRRAQARPAQAAPGAVAPQAQTVRRVPNTAGTLVTSAASDRMLAEILIIGNEGEAQLGQFAEKHARDAGVKQFARKMIEDHTSFAQKLQKFATQSPTATPAVAASKNPEANAVAAAQVQTAPDAVVGAGLDPVQIHRELGADCLSATERELLEGPDFDKGYVIDMVKGHVEMLGKLKVFRNHASPELAQLLDEGSQTTQKHLNHAKELLKKYEAAAPKNGAASPTTPAK